MESIQDWAMTVCITMAGASVFSMLVPNSNLKKVVSFTIQLFFLSSLISPLILHPPQLDFTAIYQEAAPTEELEAVVNSQTQNLAEEQLRQQLEQLLSQNGYKIEQIEIHINQTEDNGQTEIILTCDPSEQTRQAELSALIERQIGVSPQILYTDNEVG